MTSESYRMNPLPFEPDKSFGVNYFSLKISRNLRK